MAVTNASPRLFRGVKCLQARGVPSVSVQTTLMDGKQRDHFLFTLILRNRAAAYLMSENELVKLYLHLSHAFCSTEVGL